MSTSVAAAIPRAVGGAFPSPSSENSKHSRFSSLRFPSELRAFTIRNQRLHSKLRSRTLTLVITIQLEEDETLEFGYFCFFFFLVIFVYGFWLLIHLIYCYDEILLSLLILLRISYICSCGVFSI